MTARRYRVGDLVRVTLDGSRFFGDTGTVTETHYDREHPLLIEIPDPTGSTRILFAERAVELIEEAASHDLAYTPTTVGIDTGKYDVGQFANYRGDTVSEATVRNLADLATSEHWEDRIRAEVLRERIEIRLPDQFPCIYETADSPSRAGLAHPRPNPWVISPDIDMLHALLDDYQELWDAYTSQWGEKSRRTFAVGRLDGLKPHGVYRPGTTPEQVIGSTMLTHTDMYGRAPERLRAMHPQHATWVADRERRMAEFDAEQAKAAGR
jgi:hypothetical protein